MTIISTARLLCLCISTLCLVLGAVSPVIAAPFDRGNELLLFDAVISSDNGNFEIISNGTWRTTNVNPGPLFATLGFNDALWTSSFAPYPNGVVAAFGGASAIIPGTSAQLMWYWDQATPPSGSNGPNEAWFRKTISLDEEVIATLSNSTAEIIADDVFQFFVNGTFVDAASLDQRIAVNREQGCPIDCIFGLPVTADFRDLLQPGENVFAFYSFDGAGVPGPPQLPEPSTVWLLIATMIGFWLVRHPARRPCQSEALNNL